MLVQVAVAITSLYWQVDFSQWLVRYSILTGATLPATLAWLILSCACRNLVAAWPVWGQYAFGLALGGLVGLYGCGMLAWTGLLSPVPWLASALTGAALAALLVAMLVLRAKGNLPAATSARLSELQARIRPHFLFNTLNSAIALVRAEPAQAEGLLEDLSDLFRHALADADKSVTLEQEIALAQRYLAIEQVRFGERMRVTWSLDPSANNAQLPHLLLQPLVENAVVHGVERCPDGADIKVRTQRRGDKVAILIANTVPADWAQRDGGKGNGIALANVRDRLALLHDVRAYVRTETKDGNFRVRIEIPAELEVN